MVVDLQISDNQIRGSKVCRNGLSTGLVNGDLVNVNGVFQSVDSSNFALLTFVSTTSNLDSIVTVDGKGADAVFLAELLGELSAHNNATDMRGGLEVGFPRLRARAGNLGVLLHYGTIMLQNGDNSLMEKHMIHICNERPEPYTLSS